MATRTWTPAQRLQARETTLARNAEKKRLAGLGVTVGKKPGVVPGLGTPDTITPGVGIEDGKLNITVKADMTPKQKPTLRERLGLGGPKQAVPTPIKRPTTRRKSDTPNLIVTLLPTILASLIATYARDRLPDEYQPCAPSKEEVGAILGPIMAIIGRRVEVAAQVSQDAIDLSNAIICTFAYSVRAYITYVDIKKAKERGIPYEQKQQERSDAYRARLEREAREYNEVVSDPEATLSRGLRAYQAQNNGTGVNPVGIDGGGSGESINGTNGNGATNPDDVAKLREYEAGLIGQMFARDRAGRVKLGLLPS